MSVQTLLHQALADALRGHEALAGELTGIFDAPPVRAGRPYLLIDEALLADWGTKDAAGREGRFAIRLFDGGERPLRLRLLVAAVEDAVHALPHDLGDGWAIVTLQFLRSRISRDGEVWSAISEFRVRMLRTDA